MVGDLGSCFVVAGEKLCLRPELVACTRLVLVLGF